MAPHEGGGEALRPAGEGPVQPPAPPALVAQLDQLRAGHGVEGCAVEDTKGAAPISDATSAVEACCVLGPSRRVEVDARVDRLDELVVVRDRREVEHASVARLRVAPQLLVPNLEDAAGQRVRTGTSRGDEAIPRVRAASQLE